MKVFKITRLKKIESKVAVKRVSGMVHQGKEIKFMKSRD